MTLYGLTVAPVQGVVLSDPLVAAPLLVRVGGTVNVTVDGDGEGGSAPVVDIVGSIAAVDGSAANLTLEGLGSQAVTTVLGFVANPATALLTAVTGESGIYSLGLNGSAPHGYTITPVSTPAEGDTVTWRGKSGVWATSLWLAAHEQDGTPTYVQLFPSTGDPSGWARYGHFTDSDFVIDTIVSGGKTVWRYELLEVDVTNTPRTGTITADAADVTGQAFELRVGVTGGGDRPDLTITGPDNGSGGFWSFGHGREYSADVEGVWHIQQTGNWRVPHAGGGRTYPRFHFGGDTGGRSLFLDATAGEVDVELVLATYAGTLDPVADDLVVNVVGFSSEAGVCRTRFAWQQDSDGGHAVTFTGVEWPGGEPTFDTSPDVWNLVQFDQAGLGEGSVVYATPVSVAPGGVSQSYVDDAIDALTAADVGALASASGSNTANGWAKLDGSGTLPDILGPSSWARDSEVTSAVSTHAGATDPHGDRAFATAAVAALSTVYQPVDSDLTAIAALTTTSYGRALLALADASAGRTALGLGTAATSATTAFDAAGAAAAAQAASQPLDSDLTAIAALTTTTYGRSLLTAADAAAMRVLAGTVIGTDVQAFSTILSSLVSNGTPGATGLALLLAANAGAARTTLGVVNAETWRQELFCDTPSASVGTWTPVVSTTSIYNLRAGTSQVVNDSISWDVWMSAGTWDAALLYASNSSAGIATITVGGTSIGTVDMYQVSGAANRVGTISGFTVATSAKVRVTITMATKNASSAGYQCNFTKLALLRTA